MTTPIPSAYRTNCEKDVTMSDAANDDPITARNIGSVQLRDAIPLAQSEEEVPPHTGLSRISQPCSPPAVRETCTGSPPLSSQAPANTSSIPMARPQPGQYASHYRPRTKSDHAARYGKQKHESGGDRHAHQQSLAKLRQDRRLLLVSPDSEI